MRSRPGGVRLGACSSTPPQPPGQAQPCAPRGRRRSIREGNATAPWARRRALPRPARRGGSSPTRRQRGGGERPPRLSAGRGSPAAPRCAACRRARERSARHHRCRAQVPRERIDPASKLLMDAKYSATRRRPRALRVTKPAAPEFATCSGKRARPRLSARQTDRPAVGSYSSGSEDAYPQVVRRPGARDPAPLDHRDRLKHSVQVFAVQLGEQLA